MADNKNEEPETPPLPWQMKIIIYIAFSSMAVVLLIYFSNFNGGFGQQEIFGQFGDFVGGVLNPFLTFLTIFLLVWSINIQMHELKLTRQELEFTREELKQSAEALDSSQVAHHKSYELQLNEVKRIQLQQALDEQYAAFNSTWARPLLKVENAPELSLEDIFDLHKLPALEDTRNFVASLSYRMDADPRYEYDVETIALKDLKGSLRRICQFTGEIYKNIESPPIASALHTKARRLNGKLFTIHVINDHEYNINNSTIHLPDQLKDLL